ncbi:MAG: PSD1 domain-containing protein [Planctomyces sp.]|nr:PSD1 domain-containing protein [Planctomyces sp.]
MKHQLRYSVFVAFSLAMLKVIHAAPVDDQLHYGRNVRPILSRYCFACHGPDEAARQADLRLDLAEAAMQKLPSGQQAIVAGDPAHSEVLNRLLSDDPEVAMPPLEFGKKPTPDEIEILKTWIAQGAEYSQHWAYIKPVQPSLPAVSDSTWVSNPIDSFVMERLDREGLKPSAPVEKLSLLRRISLDLTGLPPTLKEADEFAQDLSPGALDAAVERILAKSAYGERWAAMWLDLARYGDSQGYIHDPPRTIWRWRDWVIESLNANMPYDQMTIEMLAGDLLPNATPSQLIATGFHRNTTNNTEGGSIGEEYRHASVVDRVNTTAQVWLGSTLACAQCHSHKYDPFSHREYYQLFAVFNGTEDNNSEPPTLDVAQAGRNDDYDAATGKLQQARAAFDQLTHRLDAERIAWEQSVDVSALPSELSTILAKPETQRTKEETDKVIAHHRSLSKEWAEAKAVVDVLQTEVANLGTSTLIMKEIGQRETHVALRGDYKNRGELVTAGVPAVLNPAIQDGRLDRLGLAKWIIDPENPLAARVAVNRLWQEIFGIGIVETSEEFGNQGDPPSHPELLDWLATEYIRSGWDTKHMLKLMVTSSAYRQTSQVTPELNQRDPVNRLLARGPRVRLSAETLRDQALAVSGLLSAKMYGPPVHPPQPVNGLAAAFGASTDWENSKGEDRYRRALYTRWRRNLPYASMIAFDAPERSVCSVRRIRTNTPLQALVTLNDPVFVEAAQAFARRVLAEGGLTTKSRSEYALRLCLIRLPNEAEIERVVALFESARTSLATDSSKATALATNPLGPLPEGIDPSDAAAWTVVGNVLMNLDEFLAKR